MSLVAQTTVYQIQTIAYEQTRVVHYMTVMTHVQHGCTKKNIKECAVIGNICIGE